MIKPFLLAILGCLVCSCRQDSIARSEVVSEALVTKQNDWVKPFQQVAQWQKYPEYVDVEWHHDAVVIQFTDELAGVIWNGDLPKAPYELEFEARRLGGSDFFAALTFPVRHVDELVTLILGGWGGSVVGISSVDGEDAASPRNPTYQVHKFEEGKWVSVRLVVLTDQLKVSLDGVQIIDLPLKGKKLSLRAGPIEDFVPLSLSSFQTDGHIRKLRWRQIK